jgi:prevent-host-death family protein
MKRVGVAEFKAGCIGYLKEAKRSGKPLLVTHRGTPLAEVRPVREAPAKPQWGALQGQVRILGEIVHCDWSEEWDGRPA